MDEPTRLLDDPAAPPGLREDLRAASEIAPQSYDAERGLGRLRTALMAGTAGAAAATSAAASAGAKAGLTWAALAVAVAAGMGGALYFAVDSPAPSPAAEEPERTPGATPSDEASESLPVEPTLPAPTLLATPAEPTPAVEEVPAPRASMDGPTRRAPETSSVAAPADPTEAPSPRASTDERTRQAPETGSPAAEAPEPAPVPDDPDEQLRAEIGQLARIRARLESAPGEALALAREGERRFGNGMFGEERAALAVFALDRLGRHAEAEREARRFVAAHPVGPFTSRVRAVLDRD